MTLGTWLSSHCDLSVDTGMKNMCENCESCVPESGCVFLRLQRPANEAFTSAADYWEVTTNYMRWFGHRPESMMHTHFTIRSWFMDNHTELLL